MKISSTNDKIQYYSANGIHAGLKTALSGYTLSSIIDILYKEPSATVKNISKFLKDTGKFGLAFGIASGAVFMGANFFAEA